MNRGLVGGEGARTGAKGFWADCWAWSWAMPWECRWNNLGGDSDTTGAVAGGLAGVCYGYRSIPDGWLQQLARFGDILGLAERFAALPVFEPGTDST